LAVYNNEFILSSACVGSENRGKTTESLTICELFNSDRIHFKLVFPDMRVVRGRPLPGILSAVLPICQVVESSFLWKFFKKPFVNCAVNTILEQ